MEKIRTQFHGKETIFYVGSKIFERASYYGIRGLIVIYMISETIDMSRKDALATYAWFTTLLIGSKIIGGLVGDLLIGNRSSIIIGGLLQAIGAFTLCMPSTIWIFTGLFLIIIGGGLYSPNILSNYGKSYLNKKQLLDSAFAVALLHEDFG